MDYGELLQRLVADAVAKYDPARRPAGARRQEAASAAPAVGGGSRVSERRTREAEVEAAVVAVPLRRRGEQRDGTATHHPGRHRSGHRPKAGATAARPGGVAVSGAPPGHTHAAQGGCNQVAPAGRRIAAAVAQPSAPLPGSPLESTARATTGASRRPVDISTSAYKRGDGGGRRRGTAGGPGGTTYAQKRSDLVVSGAAAQVADAPWPRSRVRSRRRCGGTSGCEIGGGAPTRIPRPVAAAARGIYCRSTTFSRSPWAAPTRRTTSGCSVRLITALEAPNRQASK